MSKVLKRGLAGAFAVFSVLMTFLPESFFSFCHVIKEEMLKNISWLDANTCNIIIARGLLFLGLFALLFSGQESKDQGKQLFHCGGVWRSAEERELPKSNQL